MTAISVSERLLEMAAFYTPLALTVTFGQGLLAENWQIIGPSATVLQAAAWEEKVQKAYFETFTIIQTLLFLPGMLD